MTIETPKVYQVLIAQDGEIARLNCDSLEEAKKVQISFENYGKCQNIWIEEVKA